MASKGFSSPKSGSKQAFDIVFGRIAVGGRFDGSKDSRQIGVQAFVGVGLFDDSCKQLARVDKVPLGFDRIVFDLGRDDRIGHLGITNALVTGFDVKGKVLADRTVKQSAQYILFKVPAIHGTAYCIRDLPDLALQGGTLLGSGHTMVVPF